MIETVEVYLASFPMPPSANNLYATNFKTGRRFKSKGYDVFQRKVAIWSMQNATRLQAARTICGQVGPSPVGAKLLKIDQVFYFPKKAVFTLKNKPKRNDTSNRLKALHDALATILYVDDCWFWCGVFDKVSLSESKLDYPEDGFVDVRISLVDRAIAETVPACKLS